MTFSWQKSQFGGISVNYHIRLNFHYWPQPQGLLKFPNFRLEITYLSKKSKEKTAYNPRIRLKDVQSQLNLHEQYVEDTNMIGAQTEEVGARYEEGRIQITEESRNEMRIFLGEHSHFQIHIQFQNSTLTQLFSKKRHLCGK